MQLKSSLGVFPASYFVNHPKWKWFILSTVLVGATMSALDVSIVNVALPHMMGSFGQNLSSITWGATAYSIAAVIMVTMAGWWSSLLGRKKFYLISFVIFTAPPRAAARRRCRCKGCGRRTPDRSCRGRAIITTISTLR